MSELIYLDYSSTSPTAPEVLEAMLPYLKEGYGNPSSIYRLAQEAREAVDSSREEVADLLGAHPSEIYFTGGGTEANNWAIKGIAFASKKKENHLITSKIEHHSVLRVCQYLETLGFRVTYVDVDKYGVVDTDQIVDSITRETALITIMYANNEVGTIQPVNEIARLAKEKGVPFHTDAVQVVGKVPVDVAELSADLLSISGHKFYGPKGIGVLYIRRGTKLHPLLHGGHHEGGMRAGTENVPGIVGLGRASQLAREGIKEEERIKRLRNRLWEGLSSRIDDLLLNGHPVKRLAGTLNVCVKYVEGESMLLHLDMEGIAASSGSACTSGSLEPSHVLTAMGIPPEVAHGSIRFSLGKETTQDEIERVIEVLPPIVEKLRAISPFGKKRPI